ncbi:MAG: hypothetical protein EZS26_003837 [Candidatus Ordinivivax streblomastigis]|uniref:Uncharacterized protein n=1 Tax=Candidatus Ordinivivax streblomastigis TaxID=2540710 RepID=A0A5M8NTU6_9BACT|nr:MAG: hypothetical protein EZS26_003837 [Candidatus Ordinivivax streblomastigis]
MFNILLKFVFKLCIIMHNSLPISFHDALILPTGYEKAFHIFKARFLNEQILNNVNY